MFVLDRLGVNILGGSSRHDGGTPTALQSGTGEAAARNAPSTTATTLAETPEYEELPFAPRLLWL